MSLLAAVDLSPVPHWVPHPEVWLLENGAGVRLYEAGDAAWKLSSLLGDPGRRYLPADGLEERATYEVRTTTELEDMDQKRARVLAFPVNRPGGGT